MTALRNLLDNFDTNQGVGASGMNFFIVPGITDAVDRRDALILKSLADALDMLAGPEFDAAYKGSTNQSDYMWGKLHRIVFDHPLGPPFNIPPAGGAFPPPLGDPKLGIPVDGGFGVVDASSHNVRFTNIDTFIFGSGPSRRYVVQPGRCKHYFDAQTILPGGSSGVLGSPFYANLLGRWLTNDTYPVRQEHKVFSRSLAYKEKFKPAKKKKAKQKK